MSLIKKQAVIIGGGPGGLAAAAELKKKGKIRSVTYQQLMTRKLTYQNMISMYELYDLAEKDDRERENR